MPQRARHVQYPLDFPPLAFTALVDRLLEIGDDPLGSTPVRAEEPNFRHAAFGDRGRLQGL
ncbi:hypothetical protein ACQP1K_28755 (plasmid) [Sphaerimonospora sp. CA-214678]|uniref:hypothetical protein n=1 Tax=Sphaerimonospora sp. CA-214678 TaxID=3240029 RepID=UPI003D8BC077